MKKYGQMSGDERWKYTIKYRPWTFVLFITTIFVSIVGASVVALHISDPKIRHTAWIVWWMVLLYALFAIAAVWFWEKRGLLSERTESVAWRILFIFGVIICIACVTGIFWPSSNIHARAWSAITLGGPVTGWTYLKPLLRRRAHKSAQASRLRPSVSD